MLHQDIPSKKQKEFVWRREEGYEKRLGVIIPLENAKKSLQEAKQTIWKSGGGYESATRHDIPSYKMKKCFEMKRKGKRAVIELAVPSKIKT